MSKSAFGSKQTLPPRLPKHRSMGQSYDLDSLYDRLNRIYFDGQLEISIRWSHRSPSKAKSSVELGHYNADKKEIVISRRLDSPRVPIYFIEHVIFHEMLHHVFPRDNHRMHTEKFRRFERLHPDYEKARAWEKDNLKILFQSAQNALGI